MPVGPGPAAARPLAFLTGPAPALGSRPAAVSAGAVFPGPRGAAGHARVHAARRSSSRTAGCRDGQGSAPLGAGSTVSAGSCLSFCMQGRERRDRGVLCAAPPAGPSLSPSEAEPTELEHFTPKSSSLPSAAQALQTQRDPGPATAQPCVQHSLGPCKITSSPNELARQRAEAHKAAAPEDKSATQCQAQEAAPAGASHRIAACRGLVRAVPSPAGEKQLHLLLLAVVRALCELAGAELSTREVQGCAQGSFSHPSGLRGGRSPTRGRQRQAVVISQGATHLQ